MLLLSVIRFVWFPGTFPLASIRIKAVYLLDRAVPVRIRKKLRNIPEVHNHKIRLSVILTDSCSPPDNLLECRHGAYHLIKDNKLRHLAVNAGRKQL